MIAVVNYGSGNIRAITNILGRLRVPFAVVSRPDELLSARKIILPGVGAFDEAMGQLDRSGLRQMLDSLVLERQVPVLGICVGMQVLARGSEEGKLPGLGWVDGQVRRIRPSSGQPDVRLPHMGWNDVIPSRTDPLFASLETSAQFYFLHSYYFECTDRENVLARTDYAGLFASAVRARNVYGVQFHPEKSHGFGVQLLRNFADLAPC